jgi:hypothetical protein
LLRAFDRLAGALDMPPHGRALVAELGAAASWDAPSRPCTISHGTPWGLSCVVGARELRVFVEPLGDPAAVTAVLARDGAVIPAVPHAGRIWHAVAIPDGGPPRGHIYYCRPAPATLDALGLPRDDRTTIASQDLTSQPRIKAYVMMADAAIADLPDEVQPFAAAMLGDTARRIWWLVCWHHAGGTRTPTLHFHVPRHADEATARRRIHAFLERIGVDPRPWQRAADALGAHHFVTFQAPSRVATYFVP